MLPAQQQAQSSGVVRWWLADKNCKPQRNKIVKFRAAHTPAVPCIALVYVQLSLNTGAGHRASDGASPSDPGPGRVLPHEPLTVGRRWCTGNYAPSMYNVCTR